MRIMRPGSAARATLAILFAASASLWTADGCLVNHLRIEEFNLVLGAAITCTLGFAAVAVSVTVRDGIRDCLISHVRSTLPGEPPARPRLVPVPGRDAG